MMKTVLMVLAVLSTTANAQSLTACSAEKITSAMKACDSLVNISQIKCDNTACHKGLHVLTDPDYIACFEELKLGSKADLQKYKDLDDFCHGEGPDPLETGAASGANDASSKSNSTASSEETITAPSPAATKSAQAVTTSPPSSSASTAACVSSVLLVASVAVATSL